MSGTELIIILILALLLLGPEKLPEIAKLAGKTMRELEKATNDVRGTVERELHRLEQEVEAPAAAPTPPAATVVELKPAAVPVPIAAAPTPTPSTSDIDLSAKVIPMERRPPKEEGPA